MIVDGKQIRGAFFFWTGGNQEDLSGVGMNIAPNRNSARVYYKGATGLEFEFQGQKLWCIDENATGGFGERQGMRSLRHVPYQVLVPDSMVLPGERMPVPFSDFIKLEDGYYKTKISGTTLKLRKVDMKTTPLGRLRMEYKGPRKCRPVHLVMGEVSAFSGALFDIAAEPKGVEVPAGKYQIVTGMLKVGRGRRAQTATIASGKAVTIDVLPGEEAVVEVGGPYTYDFEYKLGGSLVVNGSSVKIHGRGGEVYLDVWGGVPEPTVFVRRRGSSRGRAVGELVRPENGKELDSYFRAKNQQDNRFGLLDAIFTPMDLRVRKPRGSIEVRLVERRHSLFGKVESEWK
jgi:hypothetical protein